MEERIEEERLPMGPFVDDYLPKSTSERGKDGGRRETRKAWPYSEHMQCLEHHKTCFAYDMMSIVLPLIIT